MIADSEKIFYVPGDIVSLRHSILDNIPNMYVVEKVTSIYKIDESKINSFKGIRCRWFNKNQDLCEGIFSSKDLIKIKSHDE